VGGQKVKHRAWLAIGVVILIAAADATEEATKKELAKFKGTWNAVSDEREGMKAPETEVKKVKVTFQEDKLIARQGDKTFEMKYTLDPSKNPKTIDVTYLDGELKGESSQGIYSLDGDTLKICMHRGTNRPTEFETKPDSQRHLLVLKREKR
jgi:uncharacterized protein (TIGR03067 family)